MGHDSTARSRVPRRERGHRAGRVDRAVEGRRGRRRHPELVSLESGRGAGVQPPRQGRHVPGRRDGRRGRSPTTTTGSCCPAASPTPTTCATDADAVDFVARLLRGRQAGRRDLPRARGCWSRPTSSTAGRSPRGRACRPTSATPAAPGSTRRSHVDSGLVTSRKPDDLPAFCAEADRGVRRGRARRAARADGRLRPGDGRRRKGDRDRRTIP